MKKLLKITLTTMSWCIVGAPLMAAEPEIATLGGGCFWCIESDFEKLPGVIKVISGYTGGRTANPSYKDVSSGSTGHVEVVQVYFDPQQINYQRILDYYWKNVDPTVANQQFCDVGNQYRSVIFYHNDQQKAIAEKSKATILPVLQTTSPKASIQTTIEPLTTFYEAEAYHQDYYKKNPIRYRFYRNQCGRDQRLQTIWGSASK